MVEDGEIGLEACFRNGTEISAFREKPTPGEANTALHMWFLPGTVWIAEECQDSKEFVEDILSSIVEREGINGNPSQTFLYCTKHDVCVTIRDKGADQEFRVNHTREEPTGQGPTPRQEGIALCMDARKGAKHQRNTVRNGFSFWQPFLGLASVSFGTEVPYVLLTEWAIEPLVYGICSNAWGHSPSFQSSCYFIRGAE